MILETLHRRPDGSIDRCSLDDGAGCYVFLMESGGEVVLTQQFEQGGNALGRIRLTYQAVAKLLPLFQDITDRNAKEGT